MPIQFRNKFLLLGPAADTLDASHFQRMIEGSLTFEQTDNADEYENMYRGAQDSIPTGVHTMLSYKTHLPLSGTAGTPPVFSQALQSCGFSEIIEAGSRVRYVFASDNFVRSKFRYQMGNTLHEVTECLGTVELVWEKGIPFANWQMKGLYNGPVNSATGINPNEAPWLLFKPTASDCSLNVFGASWNAYSFSAALGMEPIYDESLTREQIIFNDRSVTVKASVEAKEVSEVNLWDISQARTRSALTFQDGTEAGKIIKVTAPAARLVAKPQYQKLDPGTAGHDLELTCLPDLGQDDLEICFE